jgi:APA family basic amino acid/polyamine antiporter
METEKLPRHLTVYSGALLNIGTCIGTGIFIVQGSLLEKLGSPGLVLVLILLGGIMSIFGTWAYVELGCMRPVSGGPKVRPNFSNNPNWFRFISRNILI